MELISQSTTSSLYDPFVESSSSYERFSSLKALLKTPQTTPVANPINQSTTQPIELSSASFEHFLTSLDAARPTTGQSDFFNALAKASNETIDKFTSRQGLNIVTQFLEELLKKSPLPNKLVSSVLKCIIRLIEAKKIPSDHKIFETIEELSGRSQLSTTTSDLILQIVDHRELPATSRVLYDPLSPSVIDLTSDNKDSKPKTKKSIRFVDDSHLCQFKFFNKEQEPAKCAATPEEKLARKRELNNNVLFIAKSSMKSSQPKGILKKKETDTNKKVTFDSKPQEKIEEEKVETVNDLGLKPEMLASLLSDKATKSEKEDIIVSLKETGQLDGIMKNIITLRRFIVNNQEKGTNTPTTSSASSWRYEANNHYEPVKKLKTEENSDAQENLQNKNWSLNQNSSNHIIDESQSQLQHNLQNNDTNIFNYNNSEKMSNYSHKNYSKKYHHNKGVHYSRDSVRNRHYNYRNNHDQNVNYDYRSSNQNQSTSYPMLDMGLHSNNLLSSNNNGLYSQESQGPVSNEIFKNPFTNNFNNQGPFGNIFGYHANSRDTLTVNY